MPDNEIVEVDTCKANFALESIKAHLCDTTHGKFWLPTHHYDDPIIQAIIRQELFDSHIVETCKPFVSSGSTVIDVGANFGQMSMAWSKMVGETGRVHSFEPSKFVAYYLRKSLELNEFCANVVLHENACWDISGVELKMLEPDGSDHGRFYSGMGIQSDERDPRTMTTHIVKSLSIDDIEYSTPVSLIKVDAQGSDYHALKGAARTIERYHPVVAFEYEPHYNPWFGIGWEDFERFFADLGYKKREDLINNGHDYIYTYKEV